LGWGDFMTGGIAVNRAPELACAQRAASPHERESYAGTALAWRVLFDPGDERLVSANTMRMILRGTAMLPSRSRVEASASVKRIAHLFTARRELDLTGDGKWGQTVGGGSYRRRENSYTPHHGPGPGLVLVLAGARPLARAWGRACVGERRRNPKQQTFRCEWNRKTLKFECYRLWLLKNSMIGTDPVGTG
jgi:hypothetical protein